MIGKLHLGEKKALLEVEKPSILLKKIKLKLNLKDPLKPWTDLSLEITELKWDMI